MPASAVALLTGANLCASYLRCNQTQEAEIPYCALNRIVGVPVQKCPALEPASPFGANEGRAKWASAAVLGGSPPPRSVTTPSCGDEAQAESSHAMVKPSIP